MREHLTTETEEERSKMFVLSWFNNVRHGIPLWYNIVSCSAYQARISIYYIGCSRFSYAQLHGCSYLTNDLCVSRELCSVGRFFPSAMLKSGPSVDFNPPHATRGISCLDARVLVAWVISCFRRCVKESVELMNYLWLCVTEIHYQGIIKTKGGSSEFLSSLSSTCHLHYHLLCCQSSSKQGI